MRYTDTTPGSLNYEDLKPSDEILVSIDGIDYETEIDPHGVHRFKCNTIRTYLLNHDKDGNKIDWHIDPKAEAMVSLNMLAVAFHDGKFNKRDYMEFVMSGYSVSGFMDCSMLGGSVVLNPLWDKPHVIQKLSFRDFA